LKLLRILNQGIKYARYTIENHKKEIALGMLILAFLVAAVAATVYNSMHLQSTVGVE